MAASRYSEENPPPQVLEEIRKRLAGVCANWPPALFESVTARAAWIEFKYAREMTDSFTSMSLQAAASARFGNPLDSEEGAPRSR